MNRRVIDRLKELALGEYDMPVDASVDQKDGFDWSREAKTVQPIVVGMRSDPEKIHNSI